MIITERFPHECHFLLLPKSSAHVVIHSGEKQSFKSEIREHCSIALAVTKWIHHPPDSWFNSELVEQELVSNVHIYNQVLIAGTSLVCGTPTPLSDLQLTIFNQTFHLIFDFLILLGIPHMKELHLHISKSSLWVAL